MKEDPKDPTTYAALVAAFEGESPEAVELLVDIMERNSRDLVNALPTWEDLDKAKQDAYWRGYAAGQQAERNAIYARIFGGQE